MAYEVSLDGSNASITIISPTDSDRSDTGDDTTWIPWIPVVVPLLALLPRAGRVLHRLGRDRRDSLSKPH